MFPFHYPTVMNDGITPAGYIHNYGSTPGKPACDLRPGDRVWLTTWHLHGHVVLAVDHATSWLGRPRLRLTLHNMAPCQRFPHAWRVTVKPNKILAIWTENALKLARH